LSFDHDVAAREDRPVQILETARVKLRALLALVFPKPSDDHSDGWW
jgi:hypothetical protein